MGCQQSKTATPAPSEPKSEKLLDKYVLGRVLGQGAFGIVYACKRKGNMEEFAVKMVDQVETPLVEIKQEVAMLRKLAHTCVVKLHDVYYEKVFVCMVLQIYRGGDMIEGMQLHWKEKGMISVPVLQNLGKMMFQATDWLHQNDVVHRDLKGDNYLQDRRDIADPGCRIFLSDFGTVVALEPGARLKGKCGTKTYWGPEFYALNYGLKVDVWALGVVIFGMVTGRFPFKGEDDVKHKVVKIPARCGQDGENFISGMLQKDESRRLSARSALEHTFLASIKSAAQAAEEELELGFKAEVKESGANAGVKERRLELVERLENQQQAQASQPEKQKAKKKKSTVRVSHSVAASSFEVHDRVANKTIRFQWWPQDQCVKVKYMNESKAVIVKESDTKDASAVEPTVRHMLEDHGIDVDQFGKGHAKKFSEFVAEVNCGISHLMLDATKHKSIVRVVDVVLLRIAYGQGPSKRYLIKASEKYPDGRMRENINQLEGTKKLPHENGMMTAQRVLKDRLNLSEKEVHFDFAHKECFEEDEESPSYPGVRTVYRKEIFEGTIAASDTSVLQSVGIHGKQNGKFSQQDAKQYTREFAWLSEKECLAKKVKLRAPEEGAEISALVMPPVGMDEEELSRYFVANGVDVAQFGQSGVNTLAEIAEELVKGESTITQHAEGRIVRIVEVVALRITRPNGHTLIEVEEELADGTKKALDMLPAVKRRADENLFWAAHRNIDRVLKVSENTIKMDANTVQLVEEEIAEEAYGTLPTIYRRRIISAEMVELYH